MNLYEPRELLVEGHPFVPVGRLKGFLEWLETNYLEVRHRRAKLSPERLSAAARKSLKPRKKTS